MMTCEDVIALLMEQDLDDLPDELRGRVQAHLDACPRCAGFVQSLRLVTPMVRDALESQVDDALQAELDAAVMEALRREA